MKKDRPAGCGGFTLLELLVVLVIIALMSALVAPQMLGSLTHMNLKTSAKGVAATMRNARSRAVSEQTVYIVRFDMEANRVSVSGADQPAPESVDGGQEGEGVAALVYSLPKGITLSRPEAAENLEGGDGLSIEFYPDGNSSGGAVILNDERGKRYLVRVDFISGSVGTDVCGEECR